MTISKSLSHVRADAGRKGAASRWPQGRDRATACLRVYPADAHRIRDAAKEQDILPADVIAGLAAALTHAPQM